jgi:catechol 2,3-dioxygenase-like lactoylglutathione lyase family enzyme
VPDVFDHVTLRVSDLEASRRFYELALAELGYGEPYRGDHFFEWEDLSISIARSDRPVTRNLHLALLARSSRDEVDAWWEAMTAAGHPTTALPVRASSTRPATTVRSSAIQTDSSER